MSSSPALPSCLRFAPALATTLAALSALGVGCHGFDAAVGPPATPGAASPDDAPPLHTGGLDVAVSSPEGVQGPGANPAAHGDPTAAAIATGIGIGVLAAGTTATIVNCAQPGADESCLRGQGPFEAPAPTTVAGPPASPTPNAPGPTPAPALLPGTCLQDSDCSKGSRCQHENAYGPKPKQERYAGAYCGTPADVCDPRSDLGTCGSEGACVYSHVSNRWACLKGASRGAAP